MTSLVALAALAAILAYCVSRRVGKFGPLTLALWLLAGIFALSAISGLRLSGMTLRASVIVAVGVVGLAAPALLARGLRVSPMNAVPLPDRRVAWPRLLICAAVLTLLVIVGFISFRSRIAGVTGGSFNDLTTVEIRVAQNGAARGGGFAGLCLSAAPVLACLGVYAARVYSRWWYLAVVLAVGALLDSPARTSVLSLAVTTLVFSLYIRDRSERAPESGSTYKQRVRILLLVFVSLAAMLYYFNRIGSATNKTVQIAAAYPDFGGPSWLISPILYFTGGLSALSAAFKARLNPFDRFGSIYVPTKIGHVFDPNIHVPDTIADFVGIPAPFNVYTAFGQLYFDFGFAGVLLLCALLGQLAVSSHRRAVTGRLEWAFVSACLANILASLQLEYRLFLVDVDFQILVGVFVFVVIGRARRRDANGTKQLQSSSFSL